MLAALAADLLRGVARGAALPLAFGLCLSAGAPAMAQTGPEPAPRIIPHAVLPGLGPQDRRRPVLPEDAPWWSLVRVQLEVGGRCTGALVDPRIVLTAAHCLVSRRSGNLVQPGSLHVLLGYHLGQWQAHGRVASFAIGQGYRPDGTRARHRRLGAADARAPAAGPARAHPADAARRCRRRARR